MASFDPYAPCPCGSSRKYKWCCQKSEDYALRVSRMMDNEQYDQAKRVVEEGLRKRPGTFWLLSLKADLLHELGQTDQAVQSIESILERDPGHARVFGQLLYFRRSAEEARQIAERLQRCFDLADDAARQNLYQVFEVMGGVLFGHGFLMAGLAHVRLAERSGIELGEELPSSLDLLRESIPIAYKWEPPWAETPDDLQAPSRERFEAALQRARTGHWASAGEAFEALAAEGVEAAKRNVGLCRLWLGDEVAAANWLSDWLERAEPTPDAVDTEVLVQTLMRMHAELVPAEQRLEYVALHWPLRDEPGLRAALERRAREDPRLEVNRESEPAPSNSPEANANVSTTYTLLDRPNVVNHPDFNLEELPIIQGQIHIDSEANEVVLAGNDTGPEFDQLKDRFLEIAGPYIPPAHPKTETIYTETRFDRELRPDVLIPEGLSRPELQRLFRKVTSQLHFERWPQLADPRLDGKTPREAAETGRYTIPLRARILRFELEVAETSDIDYDALRSQLGLEPEPPLEVENNTPPLRCSFLRQHFIPFDRLPVEQVWIFLSASSLLKLRRVHERAGDSLLSRPNELARLDPGVRRAIYGSRAAVVNIGEGPEAAAEWIRRGRDEEPESHRSANAQLWDLDLITFRANHEPEERWAPELIHLVQNFQVSPAGEFESDQERESLEKYRQQHLMRSLSELGLVRLVQRSEDPADVALDTRGLHELMERHGSSLTTPTGEPASSSARPTIWTPNQEGGRSGGIWTPSADAGSQSGPSTRKIITPDD